MACLSQDELVKKIGGRVSKNAISKYEKGSMMPDSEVLIALANALDVKPDFFFRSFNTAIEHIEFRKKQKLGLKEERAIREKVISSISNYIELESCLDIASVFENPVASHIIKNKRDVEQAANEVLKAWDLGSNALPNVIGLLEDKEIKVVEIDANAAFDGFSGIADGRFPVIVLNSCFGIERKRLTALHELGHLLLQFDQSLTPKQIESMCYQFAAAMLMPFKTFQREFGKRRNHISMEELIAMKETYGISVQAIMARARSLEIISEHLYRQFSIKISKNRAEKGLGHYHGEEKSRRFKQLLYRAVAENIISMSRAANLANKKLAEFRKDLILL